MLIDSIERPVAETSLSVYFMERLSDHARHFSPPPQEDTCWYVSSLLARFGRSDQLFVYDNEQLTLRPLALLYGDALEASSERERCLLLQQLGDMALFLGALFPGRFSRRGLQRDYVAGMGGGAYDYLAANARHNRHIYAELSCTFTRILELVARVCSRRRELGVEEVMALYRRWQDTADPVAASQLRALGIDIAPEGALH